MGVKAHLSVFFALMKLEIATALQYRLNFMIQSIGMIINDLFWILFWYLLFQRFDTINGWGFEHMALTFAILSAAHGFAVTFFQNTSSLSWKIEQGDLDYYLTLPKPVLLHSMVKMNYSGVGDLVLGLSLGAILLPDLRYFVFLFFVFTAMIVRLGWPLIFHSLSFYLGHFERAARAISDVLGLIGTYPFSVFGGGTKFLLAFIIPVGLMVGFPVETIFTFDPVWMALIFIGCVSFFLIGAGLFYKGLRRYSSGNVMVMRG